MAMDRFYDAEDGNIWIAFPSTDRNKIDIDTFLILKKGPDSSSLITDEARYKILALEIFIKSKKYYMLNLVNSQQAQFLVDTE